MMDAFKTARYHGPGLIALVVVLVLILLSCTPVHGACNGNDFVPSVEPFPPGGFIGDVSPFDPVDPNLGNPCPFGQDSGTGAQDPFAPGGFIGGPCPFPQVDPNTGGTICPFGQDSGTGAQDPFAPGGYIGGPCPFPQVDPGTGGTPCPFSSQSTTGTSSIIQAVMNSVPCTENGSGTDASQGSTTGSGSAQETVSGNGTGASSGNSTVVSCPLYPGLNTNPTVSPTPAPTIVPQPVIKPVPQEPGTVKYSATGWSNVTYKMPTDPNKDGLYEDLNADGRADFLDVILLFKDQEWLQENEPIQYFDFDGDKMVTFKDVITLFKNLPDEHF